MLASYRGSGFFTTIDEGVSRLAKLGRQQATASARRLCCEPLESRRLMSTNVGELPLLEAPVEPYVQAADQGFHLATQQLLGDRDQDLAISAVHLKIGERQVVVTSLDDPVVMEVGDTLQVVGVDYRLQGDEGVSGKIAFEGYLNKYRGNKLRTGDVITGRSVQSGELPMGESHHPGLKAAWRMKAGTESVTLVMVRYANNEAIVEDRIKIRTQVGTPDFALADRIKIQTGRAGLVVGERVKLYGAWGNLGEGVYKNYAEVDIYHESDPTTLVWVGSISDVVGERDFDTGEFTQRHREKGFSKRWIPELGGVYTLKIYVDPEDRWAESDESNNVGVVQVEVSDHRNVAKGKGAFGRALSRHDAPGFESPGEPAIAAPTSLAVAADALFSDSQADSLFEPRAAVQAVSESLAVERANVTPKHESAPVAVAQADHAAEAQTRLAVRARGKLVDLPLQFDWI